MTFQQLVQILWIFVVVFCVVRFMRWLVGAGGSARPRPITVLCGIITESSRRTVGKVGIVLISPRAYAVILDDLNQHQAFIVRSGEGILISGMRVAADPRIDDQQLHFIYATEREYDHLRN